MKTRLLGEMSKSQLFQIYVYIFDRILIGSVLNIINSYDYWMGLLDWIIGWFWGIGLLDYWIRHPNMGSVVVYSWQGRFFFFTSYSQQIDNIWSTQVSLTHTF